MRKKWLVELGTMLLIGDGVVALVAPRRHSLLWRAGPRPFRELMAAFARRPALVRCLATAEAAAGLWLAFKQYPK